MFILLMVENWKVQRWSGSLWHGSHAKYHEELSGGHVTRRGQTWGSGM